MSEKKPVELVTVDSFSQLPFIGQRQLAKEKNAGNNNGIRLFGIEFPLDRDEEEDAPASPSSKEVSIKGRGGVAAAGSGCGDSQRRFECHYCCRNFPTSQALGGHQNAHKRERQQAKKAHLQSVHMSAHQYHGMGGHVYGLLNYHRFGGIAPQYGYGAEPLHLTPYLPWGSTTRAISPRLFAGPGSVAQPINGCPVTGAWRVPPSHATGAPVPLALLEGHSPAAGSEGRLGGPSHVLQSKAKMREGAQDHLSLDLHL